MAILYFVNVEHGLREVKLLYDLYEVNCNIVS